jgi:hypothetical protein
MWYTPRFPGRILFSLSDHDPTGSRRSTHRRRSAVFRLERLEERTVLSTLTVLNNLDSGPGSLRDTIAAADNGDTIDFAKSVHKITLTGGELTINKSLDIEGPGADKLTISGNDARRVFDISGAATTTVTIAGLTITDGLADGSDPILASSGGGILNADNLILSKVVLTQNVAQGSNGHDPSVPQGGGGIFNEAGAQLTLKDSLLTNNQAKAGEGLDVFGGGLLNLGTATVTSSTFKGNAATGGANPTSFFGGSVGGAIDNFGSANFGGAKLTVTASTFTGNLAEGAAATTIDGTTVAFYGIGGAIENNAGFNKDSPSIAMISYSIFQSNVAKGDAGSHGNGGAIANEGGYTDQKGSHPTTMILTNSSLIANQSIGGDGANGLGGGIINAQGSTLNVTNSTFIGNQAIGGSSTPSNPTTFAFGGGINNTSAGLTVSDSSLFGNEALTLSPGGVAVGGGIENGNFAGPAPTPLHLTNCTLSGNQAIGGSGLGGSGWGGGLDNSYFATATITGSQIINNQALGGSGSPGGDGRGGGISVGIYALLFGVTDNASITVRNSTIASNLARGGNGGSGADGGDGLGGGVSVLAGSSASIDASLITANAALGGFAGCGGASGQGVGGGFYIDTGAVVELSTSSEVIFNFASTSNKNIFGVFTTS